MLATYQQFFSTVELNNSFYKLPPPASFEKWKKASSANFIYAVKANRFLTHMKKLIADKDSIQRLFNSVNMLGKKLGPILFQLPPRWKINSQRLEEFILALPKGHRFAFEFREHSWYNGDIYAILEKYNCAFCIYELDHHLSPLKETADFVYIRLHGPGDKYQGSYNGKVLNEWAGRIKDWLKKGKDVYIYFDNDKAGYAAFNAISLKKMLNRVATV